LETKFPTIAEIRMAYILTRDYCRFFFPVIPYRVLQTSIEEVDDIHGEILEENKTWANPVDVRGFGVPTMVTQPLTKFGIEDKRVCDLVISVPDLVAAGLAIQDEHTFEITLVAGIGDRFTYHGRDYSVLTFIPGARWANTDAVLYFELHSELYREKADMYSS